MGCLSRISEPSYEVSESQVLLLPNPLLPSQAHSALPREIFHCHISYRGVLLLDSKDAAEHPAVQSTFNSVKSHPAHNVSHLNLGNPILDPLKKDKEA